MPMVTDVTNSEKKLKAHKHITLSGFFFFSLI